MNLETIRTEARKLLGLVQAEELHDRIEILFNPRMRTRAGACTYRRIRRDHVPGKFQIELNPTLLLHRHPEALLPTLAHELAHVVVRARFGGNARNHGKEWTSMLKRMGHTPERCHNMNVEGLKRKTRPSTRWICLACNKIVTLGPVQSMRENRRGGSYVCLCGGRLERKPARSQQCLF